MTKEIRNPLKTQKTMKEAKARVVRKPVLKTPPVFTDEKYVCFNKINEDNGVLSNWYVCDFEAEGKKFTSAEQYVTYKKAVLFGDNTTRKLILSTSNPNRIKALSKQIRNYNGVVWHGVRRITLYEGLLCKFTQNAELKEFLIETGDALLCCCSKSDTDWGVGLDMSDAGKTDMANWTGANLLGFVLMKVREKIKE